MLAVRSSPSYDLLMSHPKAKRSAARTSFILDELSWANRLLRRFCDTVTEL